MSQCFDCFQDARSLNDRYAQTKIDAQKFANEKNTKVAIIQQPGSFSYEAFTSSLPAGAREVIMPAK